LAQLAAAPFDRLTAERRRLVDGIGSVALDPDDFFEWVVELIGDDLPQRG
jgi:hypothetical protein